MKRNPLFLILALIFVFLTNSALAQQDPLDPGQADTLYFVAGYPCSPEGDTIFFPTGGGDATIHINIWNDEGLVGMAVPLTDLNYGPPSYAFLDSSKNNGSPDPLCFIGSRVESFDFRGCNLLLHPPQVLYGAVAYFHGDSLPPGDGLFATMIYTVEDTGSICLDTVFFPPENYLKLVTSDVIGFKPIFIPSCFQLAPYLCGDADGDRIVNVVDVTYLIEYLFKGGPSPVFPSDVNCDGDTSVSDVTYLIDYLFRSGFPPCDPDNDGQPNC
jgi:hypothetical protein